MSSKYALWLNYDNDSKKYRIPVNPEKITVKVNGKVTTCDIDSFGTLLHKGRRDAIAVSWSSFFPSKYGSYCACTKSEYKTPGKMHAWILALMNAKDPVHLVLTGGPLAINIHAVVTSYQVYESGGDPGTLSYSIELREYRSVTINIYKKNVSSGGKIQKTTSKERVSNKQNPKTYTVKFGDCLYNLAKKFYGNGSLYTKIYNANRNKIKDPNIIKIGWVLTIP